MRRCTSTSKICLCYVSSFSFETGSRLRQELRDNGLRRKCIPRVCPNKKWQWQRKQRATRKMLIASKHCISASPIFHGTSRQTRRALPRKTWRTSLIPIVAANNWYRDAVKILVCFKNLTELTTKTADRTRGKSSTGDECYQAATEKLTMKN